MTGFARRERQFPWGSLAWELRTVNHRFLEVSLRLPEEFRALEAQFRQVIAQSVRRGKLDGTLSLRPTAAAASLDIDANLLGAVTDAAVSVANRVGGTARINVADLLRWPGVIRDSARDVAPLLDAAQELLVDAIAGLGEFRASEGARLAEHLEQRAGQILELAERVRSRLPEVRDRIRAKWSERLAQLTTDADPARLEQELAILAQRLDVDEELDRLRGHVEELRKTLAAPEPAGRRLDFLMQEFNREANTLGSKSQDLDTTRAAVDMKVLIEQMREQVQNVE